MFSSSLKTARRATEVSQGYRGLLDRFETRSAKVGIIGLGYVGVPLALAAVRAGVATTGFDVDLKKVVALNEGSSYIRHISNESIGEAVASGRFTASANFAGLADMDAIIICVPTPITKNCSPDVGYITSAADSIAEHLRAGQLVVLESTTYPGTTSGELRTILERSGLQSGEDFFLAFSPEREDPGNEHFTTTLIPKVVGGEGAEATSLAEALYRSFGISTVTVSSADTAEAVKLTENVFRAVNIALVNELKTVFGRMGIDVWEVIKAAETKPFGFMAFYPGPGVGGHCIPADPYFLTARAREFKQSARLIEIACEINRFMPEQVVDGLARALDFKRQSGLAGSRILVLGAAYKKNVDDVRDSPALHIIDLLEKRRASVDYHDSYVPTIPWQHEFPALEGRRSVPIDARRLARYDAVLIATEHDDVDYQLIKDHAVLIADTRNAFAKRGLTSDTIVKL